MASSRLRTAACWLAAIVVGGLVLFARTQEPSAQQPQPTFRAGVNIVQVDVSVLDDQRKPVRGLKASDFTVLEDGKPREIVAFTAVDLPPRMTANTAAPVWANQVAPDVATNELPAQGRLVVIAFDWSIRFDDSQTARKIATATVNSLGPGDQAAVIYTSAFANAGNPQNFTSDRALLLRAINGPMQFAIKGFDVIEPSAGGFINQNGQMLEDPNGYAEGDCQCRACSLDAMTRVANAMRTVTGRRKVLIFIGTYFRGEEAAMQPARQAMRGLPPPPGAQTAFQLRGHQVGPGTCSQPLKEAREKFERAAGLANLTVHVVDPAGLETLANSPLGGASPETIQVRQDSLHMPADLTGGRTVLNTNTPEDKMPSILDETQAYYLLGFPASDSKSSRFHDIDVKVNRPGVHVRARNGYYGNEEAAALAAGSPRAPLARAVDGALPRTDIPLSLVAVPFATPGKSNGTVALTLGVRAPTSGAARTEPVHLAIAALDPKGRLIASREATAEISAGRAAGAGGLYEIQSRLDLAPGRYEIRVAADNSAGQRGSVFAFVDVPDFAKAAFSLTGIAVTTIPAAPSAPANAFADLMPTVPTTRRAFASSDRVTAFLKVQQAASPLQTVAVLIQIAGPDGRIVFDESRSLGPGDFTDAKTADVKLDLPMSRFQVGEHLLVMQASVGADKATRTLRFRMQ